LSRAGNKGENKALVEDKVWAAFFNPAPQPIYLSCVRRFWRQQVSTTLLESAFG
jgi:hypothetical protein